MASVVVQIRIRLDSAKADGDRAADSLASAIRDLNRAQALLSSELLGSDDPQLKAAAAAVRRLGTELRKTSETIQDAGRRASDWGQQL